MTAPDVAPEDLARADLYALLAQLFYAPPEGALLQALAGMHRTDAAGEVSALAGPWLELARRAADADPDTVREEYESLFIGTGRAEVTPYTAAYTLASALDNPLVEIREFLDAQGLARKQSVHEPEDHIAALCEVMRHLILRDDAAAQRKLFESFLWPAASGLCDAISSHPNARFYAAAARFAKTFFELEHTAFDMD
ncbi:MAG: molecular chaperone [Betaproteobacteria bacterium]|nr:MAG: molecular chaperone [Betaproteobacteria bacterium]